MQPTFEIIGDKPSWGKILESVDNYDFYHTYDYHHLSKATNETPILVVYKNKSILIAIPFLLRRIFETDYFDLTSVYGYAGPLQKNVTQNFDNKSFSKELNLFFNEKKIVSVFSRLNPFINYQEKILSGLGEIKTLSNIVNIDLTQNIDEQKTHFSKTTKRYINKSNKICEIITAKDAECVKVFKDLYYENMDRVKAKKSYYFTEKYLDKFLNSPDFKTELLLVTLKDSGEIISGAMFVKSNNIVQYHISGTKNNYLHLTPIRILINHMRIKATEEGFTYFNLGGGLGSCEDSLFQFKSSFSKDFKPFKIWKHIVNKDIYDNLANEFADLSGDQNYFPVYRNN